MKVQQIKMKKRFGMLAVWLICVIGMMWCSGITTLAETKKSSDLVVKLGGESIITKTVTGADYECLARQYDWNGSIGYINIVSKEQDLSYTVNRKKSLWGKEGWCSITLTATKLARDKNGKLCVVQWDNGEGEKQLAGTVFEDGKVEWGDNLILGLDKGNFSELIKRYGYQDDMIFKLRFLRFNEEIEMYQHTDFVIVYDNDEEQIFNYDREKDSSEDSEKPTVGSTITLSTGQYKITKSDSTTKEVTYVKPKNSKKTSATIPATVTIDGYTYKVTAISNQAFKNNKKLKTVTIGKNVKKIGKEAFSGCMNLKKITIKSAVLKSVEKNAMKGINSKATIKVPKKQLSNYEKLFKSQKNTISIITK